MPGFAHLVAAANVGDHVHHAAIQQSDAVAVERGRHARAVGTISVKEKRRFAVLLESFAVNDRQRHLDAVARDGPLAFGRVLLGSYPGTSLRFSSVRSPVAMS